MIRLPLFILISVEAAIVFRTLAPDLVSDSVSSPTIATVTQTNDVGAALNLISGTTRPSKPWTDDLASFVTTHPGQWIVGHCAQPCLSEPEAALAARSDAAPFVWAIVAARFQKAPEDAGWLQKRVTADIVAGRLDADSLAERFDRPYGTVWTESVLLNVSPDRVDSLLNSYKKDQKQMQQHQIRIRESVAISVVGAWLGYLCLNAMTKGYFTTRLRLAAMLVTAVGVALLV